MKAEWRRLGRVLAFRFTREDLETAGGGTLALGLGLTWLVGLGRWWDDPTARALQKTGLGSVAYVFLLALVVWLMGSPLKLHRWRYRTVLTFVTLTAPPALLYAIPVERFWGVLTASRINLWFLVVVAAWRVGLLWLFLRRYGGLPAWGAGVTTFMPLTLVVTALVFLKLAQGIIQIMGGIREMTSQDGANFALLVLTVASYWLAIPLVLAWGVLIYRRRKGLS